MAGTAAGTIRVLLAEDQAMVRGALSALLRLSAQDIQVVAEAGDGAQALALARDSRPDVALLDIEMPRLDGIRAAEVLRSEFPDMRLILLTTFARPGYVRRAMSMGVDGYLLKDAPASELVDAIRRVVRGERVVPSDLAAQALAIGEDPLSERERQILQMADGRSVQSMAQALHLSEGTVRNYLSEAIQKLGATNRIEARRLAEERGWL